MPIAMSKGDTFKISLSSDQKFPEATRPKFEFLFLTGRQQKVLAKDLDAFKREWGNVKTIETLFSILGKYIVGWENITDSKTGSIIPFDKEKIEDILRFQGANELVYGIFGFVPELEMLKNFESQLPTPTEQSVEQVAASGTKKETA